MATINYAAREISVKIVYYGPGLSGKTTNLQIIHRKIPGGSKSDMVSLATETDRTLFFDFLPLDLGKIRGFTTKFQLYTVPGQVYYNATRKLVLRGVDGIVFIADSAADKLDENLESFKDMEENLSEYGYKRESIPIIIQYNKRDLPNALPPQEINVKLNKYNLAWSEAIANKGKGVFESLKLIGKLVIDQLNQKYASSSSRKRTAAPTRGAQQSPPPQAAPQQQPQSRQELHKPAYQTPSSYLPKQPQPAAQPQPETPVQPAAGPAQYDNINLEPILPQKPSEKPETQKSTAKASGSNDLNLEMNHYYEQMSQKQPAQNQSTQQKPDFEPLQPASNEEPTFDPAFQQPKEFQQTPMTGQPSAQPEPQTGMPALPQYQQNLSTGDNGTNEPLYFTSVKNTDKYKKKGKKPVNPRHSPKKSFFQKLFNRDSLE